MLLKRYLFVICSFCSGAVVAVEHSSGAARPLVQGIAEPIEIVRVKEAIRQGDAQTLEALLVDPNLKAQLASAKVSLPVFAMKWADLSLLRVLRARGIDLNQADPNGWTALHAAVVKKEWTILKWLLSEGANPNAWTAGGIAPVNCAARLNALPAVKLLAKHDAKLDVEADSGHCPPLASAAESGALLTLNWIASQAGVNLESVTKEGRTTMMVAAQGGFLEAMQQLRHHGASLTSACSEGLTPLHYAVMSGRLESVRWLLSFSEVKIDTAAHRGETPLMLAAKRGSKRLIDYLLEEGADINKVDKVEDSALFYAVYGQQLRAVQRLLTWSVALSQQNAAKENALMVAAKFGQVAMVEVLLKAGVPSEHQDAMGKTALILAVEAGQLWVVEYLLHKTNTIDIADNAGKTALMYAAERAPAELLERFIVYGASLQLQDAEQKTALMYAVRRGEMAPVEVLLHGGASLEIQDAKGKSVLMQALEGRENSELVALILEKRQNLELRDQLGRTALFYAVTRGERPIVERLIALGASPGAEDAAGLSLLEHAQALGFKAIAHYIETEQTALATKTASKEATSVEPTIVTV